MELEQKIRTLLSENQNYGYVLDYAIFGSPYAAREGDYDVVLPLFSDFQKCLDQLIAEGVIVPKSGSRYTGQTRYFEATIDNSKVMDILKDFYEGLKKNVEFLRSKVQGDPSQFFRIYESLDHIWFSDYDREENVCVDLVKKGLMFAWTWVTRTSKYRCYKFREQPFNCAEEFRLAMQTKLDEFAKAKVKDYLRHEMAARLDFLLGISRMGNQWEAEKYMKERGWSEKTIQETRWALGNEKISITDQSSSMFKSIRQSLTENTHEIDELVQVRKPQEISKLGIVLSKEKIIGKAEPEFEDIVKSLERGIQKLKEKNVEILRLDIDENKIEVRLVCNRLLYLISATESDINSIPTFSADKAMFFGKKILDYAFNSYIDQGLWSNLLLCTYKDNHVLGNFENDTLFRFVMEQLRADGIVLMEPINRIAEYFANVTASLKKSLTLNEGFVYTEPYNPWSLQQEFLALLKNSSGSIKLCVPYPDASTFVFIASIPSHVSIKILFLSDKEELKARKENKVDLEVLNRTLFNRRVEMRRNPEIHVRFIISDDKIVMFSSSDLKEPDLRKKYQYGFWTNNEQIVRKAIEYFEYVWKNSTEVNLFEELR